MNNFGWALEQLKSGNKVCRFGWNGKNMFLFLVPGSTFKVNRPPLLGIYPEGTEINYQTTHRYEDHSRYSSSLACISI